MMPISMARKIHAARYLSSHPRDLKTGMESLAEGPVSMSWGVLGALLFWVWMGCCASVSMSVRQMICFGLNGFGKKS